MKKSNYILITCMVLTINSCIAQENSSFDNFLLKFPDFIFEQSKTNIDVCSAINDSIKFTLEEYEKFINTNEQEWAFKPDYSYSPCLKIRISERISGLVFYREYFPFEPIDQRWQYVFATYENTGKMIAYQPICGRISDDISFIGKVNSDLEIIIDYTEYVIRSSDEDSEVKKYSNRFKINDDGQINKIK